MRIGFNLFPYAKGRHGGAEVYLTQVVRESLAANDDDRFVLIGEDDVLDQFDDDRVEKVRIPSFVQRGRGVRIVSEQLVVPYLVRKHRIDCLVSNYVVPVASPCRNVVIVHDIQNDDYRAATDGYPHRLIFDGYKPCTGILWVGERLDGAAVSTLRRLNRRVAGLRDDHLPDDLAFWRGVIGELAAKQG